MSPPSASTQSDSESAARDALVPPAETVRSCANRERRLTEYIRAHTGEDIAVRLTPHVPTACVIPTSEEALIESDNAEFSDEQARQLVESVDADYLVLISTAPATIGNLPISDQLTADRAQQFGYALHELGHIRYTAIADAAARLEERVEEEHQEFAHGLWNSCEDAAIENQLALDQSQLAADRLELVSRSISPHADGFAADDCYEFTFRDALDTALYDEGIYDTGVRDALCDPEDGRIVFAGDADQQAYEQVADSIGELVATVLSTPHSVERVEHVLDWWETVVKPLLDPSEQNQQESGQPAPDPDGATGESRASASTTPSSNSSTSFNDCGTDQPRDESADANHSSSESADEQSTEDTAHGADSAAESANSDFNEGGATDETAGSEEADGKDRVGEKNETSNSQPEDPSEADTPPDPDAINTDQRQPSPGADALDYPDIGGDEDADALEQLESGGGSKSEPESDDESAGRNEGKGGEAEDGEAPKSQSSGEATDSTQPAEDSRDVESDSDAPADNPTDAGAEAASGTETGGDDAGRGNTDASAGSDNSIGSDDEGDTDETRDGGTGAGNREEAPGSGDEQSSQPDSPGANHGAPTDAAGGNGEQDSEAEPERPTPESQSHDNPWGTSNSTSQTSLGSFSTTGSHTQTDTETESGASSSGSGNSDETPATASDTNRDESLTDAGDTGEPDPEPKSEAEAEVESEAPEDDAGSSPKDTVPDDGDEGGSGEGANTSHENGSGNTSDEEPTESTDVGSNIGSESDDNKENVANDTRTTSEDGSDANAGEGDDGRDDTPTENASESDEQSPNPTPAHADSTENLDREGALDTDREAAHDEAGRATPDEAALERDLEDVADALDALAEQDGGGAAPGSLSELAIMPDTGGSSTANTVKRWGEATADAEFVADALRKALKESRRDAHRSGVTSGTFDRQRAGALARGDVGAFHVRQPGDDKQYDLVMILDRSGSMRRHIKTAEDALVRFALACEDIGINVGVIDFTQAEARLIKPFSVECEHVHESLFSNQVGGGTPLADALGLGRELLEQRCNSPLVLVVTDGKPGDEDAYHDELAQSYAPVCGLTLVLDQPSGSVPEKVARNERFYDRHVYVHEPSQLADRLDQFAVMFDGL